MISENHLEVRRTARYFLQGELSKDVTDVWFACHGYGQLASDFVREFECIDAPHRLVVVPEALSRFYLAEPGGVHGPDATIGATWMTREDRDVEIADYVSYLDDLYDAVFASISRAGTRVTVIGFSQGGATASRWLTRGRAVADSLMMWGSLLPNDLVMSRAARIFNRLEMSVVYGKRDKYADAAALAAYEALLRENKVDYQLETFDGGHRMDRETLKRLAQSK